jgi:hypothetical protein
MKSFPGVLAGALALLLLSSCNQGGSKPRPPVGGAGGSAPTGGAGGGSGGTGGAVQPPPPPPMDSSAGGAGGAGGAPAGRDASLPADRAPSPDTSLGGVGNEPALQMFDSPCLSVPDPDVSVGSTLVATAIQWNAYFFTRDGKMDHMYKWGALRGRLVSDTHIVYDVLTKKWFMTTIVDLGGGSFGVQFMVSTDEMATAWKLSVPIEMPRLIDDPQPTVTSDKVVITESGKCVWAVDKNALIAGNAPTVKEIRCDLGQNNQVAAVKFGGEPPATAYAIVMSDSTHVNWISTEGAPGSATTTEHKLQVPMVNEVPLSGITQAGKAGLESGQVKAMWNNNHIVWSKTVRCPTSTCIRTFDVDTAANTITSTDFSMEGTQLFYGAPGLDRAGNTWVLAAATKPDGFVGLALAGRSPTGQVYAPKQIVMGGAAIGGSGFVRFGDYASASQDPTDGSLWLIGQYAGAPRGMNPENSSGCKVVHVTAR